MKKIISSVISLFCAVLIALPVHADGPHPRGVRLDGTVGSIGKIDLPGPGYEIKAEYGRQAGANLFHSFQQFNIHSDESATFSGPDSVQNIISRVTGGDSSWIDGKLRSTIPDADLYLLNPAGLMFGPNASLYLGGSFHVSTADYLRMGENEQFFSIPTGSDVLSVSAPTAFGFLDNEAAPVTFKGGETETLGTSEVSAGMSVTEGETVSVIGGDIEIKGIFYQTQTLDENGDPVLTTDGEGNSVPVTETIRPANIEAPGGQINLISVGSEGEVETGNPAQTSDIRASDITLSDKSLLDVSGTGAGSVLIRGGRFVADDSRIHARTLGDRDAGEINIQADQISFSNGSAIEATTHGTGRGADVTLKAQKSVAMSGENSERQVSIIALQTYSKEEGAGNAGTLAMEAKNISLRDGATVVTSTIGKGRGGDITVRAEEKLSAEGESSTGWFSMFMAMVNPVNKGGDGGNISVRAGDISLIDGGYIATPTFGPGNSGDVTVRATGTVTAAGAASIGQPSTISSYSIPRVHDTVAGDSGDVVVEAGELILRDGGLIATNAEGISEDMRSSNAGDITVRVSGTSLFAGVNPHGEIMGGCLGAGIYATSYGGGDRAGDAGDISLETGSLIIEDGGVITGGTAVNNSQGGNIDIRVRDTARIAGDSSDIQLKEPGQYQLEFQAGYEYEPRISVSGIYASSESTAAGAGKCGNIFLSAENLTLAEKGTISTSAAGGGRAGAITLEVGTLSADTGAVIASKSGSANFYTAADIPQRNGRFVLSGHVAEIPRHDGKSVSYVHTGDEWIILNKSHTVANMTELGGLSDQYALAHGDMAEVTDAGDGQTAGFVCSFGQWLQLTDTGRTVANMEELHDFERMLDFIARYENPFEPGQVLHVADTGDGKTETFYYTDFYSGGGYFIRLNQFTVADLTELNGLAGGYDLEPGDIVNVTDAGEGQAVFFYENDGWKEVDTDNVHEADSLADLVPAKPVNMVRVEDAGDGQAADFVLSEDKWLASKNIHTVADMAERDSLSAETGDFVRVSDTGDGTGAGFVLSDGEWVRTYKSGDAGTITIRADKVVEMRNSSTVSTESSGRGNAGTIDLTAAELRLDTGTSVSSESSSGFEGGDAGTINVSAGDSVHLSGGSSLTTASQDAGGGGIRVDTEKMLHLNDSRITTSVQGGSGSGGDIAINPPEFVTLNHSRIEANAHEGTGGNIRIVAEQFVRSSDSVVEASSEKGIDGSVNIESPDTDISAGLTAMPGNFIDAARWAVTPCSQRSGEDVGRFEIRGRDAVVMSFDGWRPSPLPPPCSNEDRHNKASAEVEK